MIVTSQKFILPYNKGSFDIEIPNSIQVTAISPAVQRVSSKTYKDHLSGIFLSDKWREFLRKTKNTAILIIINDASRATPTNEILPHLLSVLQLNNIKSEFLIATGSHRLPTDDELTFIFGYDPKSANLIVHSHNAFDDASLTYCGKAATYGTEVWINSLVVDKHFTGILSINSVEPHYFAGWTGGRKSIVPGCAGYKTLTQNHRHALSADSQICKLEGNPIHDDLMECLNLVLKKPCFSFQAVLDSNGTLIDLFGDDIYNVMNTSINSAKKIFQIPIPSHYPLVLLVTSAPLDQNLYQAHKAIENCKIALEPQGDLVLIASCHDGIGPKNFLEPISIWLSEKMTYSDFFNKISKDYKLGYHKAAKIVELSLHASLWLKSLLSTEEAHNALMQPITTDLQIWLNNYFNTHPNCTKMLIVYDACITVPVIQV